MATFHCDDFAENLMIICCFPAAQLARIRSLRPSTRFPSRHDYHEGSKLRCLWRTFPILLQTALRAVSKNWAVLLATIGRHGLCMAHPRRAHQQVSAGGNANGDGVGGLRRYDSASRTINADEIAVADDWPEDIPATAAEVDVLEMYLGDMLDAFLRPRH
jgi:hypothetical protein